MIMKHIIVIGGGFAGTNFLRNLKDNRNFRFTLVDRNNYNFFPPLLYQVATGYIEPSNISYPFRKLFRKTSVRFRYGEFLEVKPLENKVILSTGELEYDFLVFCTGTETNFFGNHNVKKNGFPMKTIDDALELRNHLLQRMEQAVITTVAQERTKLLTTVIAGGGPTGVEVAGMLAEMRKSIILKDYPEIAGQGYESHLYLVDGGPTVLKPMAEPSRKASYDALIALGVEIKLNVRVINFENDVVSFSNGERVETKTLVWAAGVSASILSGMPADSFGKGNRLKVDEFNRVNGCVNIYAIGDTCIQTSDKNFPSGHPQVAQVALQQGKNLARNFAAMLDKKKLEPFTYQDKGSMAIIGWNKAVVDLPSPRLHLKGFVAWFIWIFIHLVSLINFRNRIKTLFNWAGSYFTRDQSLRMIFRPRNKSF